MSAVDVLEGLLKLGTVITDTAAKAQQTGKFDFVAFLQSQAPQDLQDAVKEIMASLKPDDLKAAIERVEKKQKDLLAGKKLTDLSPDKLVQYSALIDTKLLLSTAVLKRAVEGDFFTWLLESGFPLLIKYSVIVLPLLL